MSCFELLDTGCTGKIHFEHFVLHSGMKDEVLKGFMRRASKEGITTDITFPKLVKLVFPKLAHRYRTHEVLASETVKKNRERRGRHHQRSGSQRVDKKWLQRDP